MLNKNNYAYYYYHVVLLQLLIIIVNVYYCSSLNSYLYVHWVFDFMLPFHETSRRLERVDWGSPSDDPQRMSPHSL